MQKQTQVVTKYAYFFENEQVTTEHVQDIFGGMNDLWDSEDKARSEMHWEQMESHKWFKKMENDLGLSYVAAVDFVDGQVVGHRKV